MIHFSEEDIDRLINEDLPCLDLTTEVLGIGGRQGSIRYITRHPTMICATEEAVRILGRLGLSVLSSRPTGTWLEAGACILEAEGPAEAIHAAWRLTGNLLEHSSGVATRTHLMIGKARKANPKIEIVTTRKSIPFARKLTIKAILAGGALPHRLGLSETVLVFDEHMMFMGGREAFMAHIGELRARLVEKSISVEVHDVASALEMARCGVDMIQMDKFSLEDTKRVVDSVRAECPGVKIAIAGGVNGENCAEFAATGVDVIVTSALYFGKPADIKAEIHPL